MSEWAYRRIRDLLNTSYAGEWGDPPSPGNARVLRATDIDSDGRINGQGALRQISPAAVQTKRLQHGDIMLEASGGRPEKPVGRVAFFAAQHSDGPFLTSNFYKTLRPAGDVDPRFLHWALLRFYRQPDILQYQQQTTGIINLKFQDYLDAKVRSPVARNEQNLIADILDTLDTQIQKTEALIAKLEKVKEGLLHDLLTRGIDENGQLRPSPEQAPELYKDSPLGLIPREWLIKEIQSICALGRGRVISQGYLDAHPGPYPVYSSQTKNDGVFGRVNDFDFEGPHVTWTTDGANAGTVTYREGRFNCTNVCGTLEARDDAIHMPFLAWALDRLTDRYVSRVGNDKLMNNVVAKMQVQIPSKNEQIRCTRSLDPIEERIQYEQWSLIKLMSQKKALMDDLLTGRVRVTPLLEKAQAATPA